MDLDEHIEKRDAEGVIKTIISSEDGTKYRGLNIKPLIQILPNGTWFIQKRGGRGLSKDPTETLLEKLRETKKK